MGFIDAIVEGIGNVLLRLGGLFVIFFGIVVMAASKGNTILMIIGLVILVIGLGLIAHLRQIQTKTLSLNHPMFKNLFLIT